MRGAIKHTPGPWHPGHLGSDGKCQCRSVVDEGYAGGICTIHVGNGLLIGEGGNDAPPIDEAIGNMHIISAAAELYNLARDFFILEVETSCDCDICKGWGDRLKAVIDKIEVGNRS